MADSHDISAFEAFERQYGHLHEEDLPIAVRQAYIVANLPLPTIRRSGAITMPSPTGQCGHCGVPVPEGQHRMAHAVAGFEDARHLKSGDTLRVLIDHCNDCHRTDRCSRTETTPDSGWRAAAHLPGQGFVGVGGYCEPLEQAMSVGMVLIPGAGTLARWGFRAMKWALAGTGLYVLSNAIVTSQGQMQATLQGTANQAIGQQDATANHGYNAGQLRVLSGSAPATANAAETGTLGINWALPATCFGAASAALPSVLTMGAVSNVNAAASITAGYARLTTGASGSGFPTLEDGTLSTTQRRLMLSVGAGSGELSFNTLTISSGGACSLTSFTISHGA